MSENLNQDQFGKPKKRWVPDQMAWGTRWHMLSWHKPDPDRGPKPSQHDWDAWHELHMKAHEKGLFEEGKEHQHFTPKERE